MLDPIFRLRSAALAAACALVILTALAAAAGPASARVPQGFVGATVEGPLYPVTNSHLNLPHEFDLMVGDGVENVRAAFDWAAAQPYESWSQVPAADASQFVSGPDNVPTTFAVTDPLVANAAQHGMTLLPVVVYSPYWDAVTKGSRVEPAKDAPYANFLTALIQRYGPHGTFWSTHPDIPKRPIRAWQVWNEPNVSLYWSVKNFQSSYVALLKAAHQAIKHADPGAKVVLAGMPNYSWDYLAGIYRIHGARSLFDEVAVHPYTYQPSGVITILDRVRGVMDRYGDGRKSMLATEVGWPSALGKTHQKYGYKTTEAGQASKTGALMRLLANNRGRLRLAGFDYETWMGTEYHDAPSFNFSGLIAFRGGKAVVKPALASFRHAALVIENCRRKGSTATVCSVRG